MSLDSYYDIDQAAEAGANLRKIPGFPGYQVTDAGDVFGLNGRRRHLTPDTRGYTRVTLRDRTGKLCTKYLHRIVWEAFKGKIPRGKEVHHIDHDPRDNRLDNLQVVSHQENIAYAVDAGRWEEVKASARRRNSKAVWAIADGLGKVDFLAGSLRRAALEVAPDARGASANICKALKTGSRAYGYRWRYVGEI